MYRHTLTRYLTEAKPTRWLGVTMLNPSVAESDVQGANDPTIRSLMRIAAFNGFDGLEVCNLSPFRATNPTDLIWALDQGADVFDRPTNNHHLKQLTAKCETLVCAWGATPLKRTALAQRASEVRELFLVRRETIYCFGRTKDGWCRHPLYLPTATPLTVFAKRGGA